MKSIKNQKGFTLIELLIVIAIIAIIAGAVLVAINPARRIAEAQDSQRASEVASIATAVSTYIVDYKGQVPTCFKGEASEFELPADGVYRWIGLSGNNDGGTWLLNGDLLDSSGNSNNGTQQEGGPSYVPGQFGQALNLDGSYYIELGGIKTPSAETFSFWFKSTQIVDKRTMIGFNDLGGLEGISILDNAGNRLLMNRFTSENYRYFDNFTGYLDGFWHHLVITTSGKDIDDILETKAYVDGSELAVFSGANIAVPVYGTFLIGDSWYDKYVGSIDELVILDYEMSASDVQDFYNNGLTTIQNGSHACNLLSDLVTTGGYLSRIPEDPAEGDVSNSGYLIKRDPSGAISVKAPHASDYAEQEIMVSR